MLAQRLQIMSLRPAVCAPRILCTAPVTHTRLDIATRASWADVAETSSYIIGKGIILFTMFYCTMNWWRYRRERETVEDAQAAEEAKKKEKK